MNIKGKNKFKSNFRKKSQSGFLAFIIFATVVSIFVAVVFLSISKSYEAFSYPTSSKIAIDAGHGGIDRGASAFGIFEADLNLEIAKTLQSTLENLNIQTVMTREDENGLYGTTLPGFKTRDMKARKKICEASNAKAVVSIHMNASNLQDRNGVVIYCDMNCVNSKSLANAISSQFENACVKDGDFFITKKIDIPAVIVECGFITTKSECEKLQTKSYQEQIATNIARGILIYQRELQS